MEVIHQGVKRFSQISAIVIGAAIALVVFAISLNYFYAYLIFPILTYIIYRIMMQQSFQRKKVTSQPFPEEWEEFLYQKVSFYRQLNDEEQDRFLQFVQIFLSEQRIIAVGNVTLNDEIKLLVASGAVTLVFFRTDWEYRNFRDILIYEDAFDLERYEVSSDKDVLGMVGAQMPIILSLKHLQIGFHNPNDGFNVVYHEFAHIIDMQDVGSQTEPLHGTFPRAIIEKEISRIRMGKSVLREYGSQNEAEFFAVATEFFFERPETLRANHPQLYTLLCRTYNYDITQPDFRCKSNKAERNDIIYLTMN